MSALLQTVLDDPEAAVRCHVLTTSRERLGVVGEVGWVLEPLPRAGPGRGPDPVASPAVHLFLDRSTAANPVLAVDAEALRRAAAICVALDGLPLPLELAAARTATSALPEIVEQSRTGARPPSRGATRRSRPSAGWTPPARRCPVTARCWGRPPNPAGPTGSTTTTPRSAAPSPRGSEPHDLAVTRLACGGMLALQGRLAQARPFIDVEAWRAGERLSPEGVLASLPSRG